MDKALKNEILEDVENEGSWEHLLEYGYSTIDDMKFQELRSDYKKSLGELIEYLKE